MAHYENAELNEDVSSVNREEFTLYVKNLPPVLDKIGLEQIFSKFGDIKRCFYIPKVTWACITYNTYSEAVNAIRDLHNKSPLYLHVTFAKEKQFNKVQVTKTPDFQKVTQQPENHNVTEVTSNKSNTSLLTRLSNISKEIKLHQTLPGNMYTNYDLLYPSDAYMYNPYENTEPYASTNALWMRGRLMITEDGKRHVSLGRGYTLYDIPYPDSKVHNHISKVYEKRNLGLYEYGKDTLQNAVKVCNTCSRKTKFACERCYTTFYCNRNCQVKDWSRHKIECEAIPTLINAVQSIPISQSNTKDQTPVKNTSKVIVHPEKKEIGNLRTLKQNDSSILEIKEREIQNENKSNELNTREEINKVLTNVYDNNMLKIENAISFEENTFLSKTKFTKVTIMVKENREFWVQNVKDEANISEVMINLQNEANKAQTVKPTIGNLYAVKFENIWQRALVISITPLKVHYIDYGNNKILDSTEEFRKIPRKYEIIPPFGFKIRLSDAAYEKYQNLNYGNIISVKMISTENDTSLLNKVINVEIQDENNKPTENNKLTEVTQKNVNPVPQISNTSKIDNKLSVSSETSIDKKISNFSNKYESIVNTLRIAMVGTIKIVKELQNNSYNIIMVPNYAQHDYDKLMTELSTICAQNEKDLQYSPQIGDLVCGLIEDKWWRGYVLHLVPNITIAAVDKCEIVTLDKVVPCPEEFSKIRSYGATLEMFDAECEFTVQEECCFVVPKLTIHMLQNKNVIDVKKNESRFKAYVIPWTPKCAQPKSSRTFNLKSGSEVCITSYQSATSLFLRLLDTENLELCNYIIQQVAKCAQTSLPVKEPVSVGQIVIAPFDDGNYYRAHILEVKEDDKVSVLYLDYGNIDVLHIKKLKYLTDDLKEVQSPIEKVQLANVPIDVPMTKDVNNYLAHLVGHEVTLTCTFNGESYTNGVYLKLNTGESVNKVISELLTPTTNKTAEEDKTCYTLTDMSTVPLGNIGSIIEAIIIHRVNDNHTYAMYPSDKTLLCHVFETLSKQMEVYCETSDSYIPREEEVCIALYGDKWSRAACLYRSATPVTSTVFFIDYGNVENVNHKDIRFMPKEFVNTPALANLCTIINIPKDREQCSPDMQKILEALDGELLNFIYVKIKIVNYDTESGTYEVELNY